MINTSIFTIVWQAILARKVLLLSLAVLLVTLPILYLVMKYQSPIQAAWFNDNWLYRATLTIGNTGSADSNKKVKFDIDTATLITAGKLQSDCGDSRFTDINGRVLKYFIDTAGGACNTASTDYYVLVPTIFSGNTVLYHYYGNPSAENGTQSSQFSEATFTPTSGPTAGSEEKSAGPVAYWKFDEGYGTTTKNSITISALDATLGTNASWKTEDQCISGKCIYIDDSGSSTWQTVYTNDHSSLGGMSALTVGIWIKTVSNKTTQQVVYKRQTGGTPAWWSYKIELNSLKPTFYVVNSSGTSVSSQADSAIELNKWYYLTGVYDGSQVQIYVNSVAADSTPASLTGTVLDSDYRLQIGGLDTASSYYVKGYLDEVKIYPYTRTAAQIKSDFTSKGSGSVKGTAASLGSSIKNLDALNNGLVGYWKTDEATWSGTLNEVVDSSGNANHGQAQGATGGKAYPSTGKFGNAGFFDGVDDNFLVTSLTTLGTDFTASFWAKPTSLPGSYQVAIGAGQGNNTIFGSIGSNGEVRFRTSSSSAFDELSSGGAGIATGNWYHVVLVKDNSGRKIYVNGVQKGSDTSTLWTTTINNFSVGMRAASSLPFNGSVDDVRIYNRALSPKEVRDLYNWSAGPVGYWNMDEKTGITAYDKSGNGINGDLISSPTWINGKFGGALEFNGSSSYVRVLNNALLNPQNLTVSAWVKSNTSTWNDYGFIVSKRDAYIIHPSSGSTAVGFYIYTTSWTSVTCTPSDITQWHYYTLTWDGTNLKCYIDGIQGSSNAPGGSINTSDTGEMDIGKDDGIARYMNGKIDDVKVYNYARNSKQIVEDMNAGHPAAGSPVGSQVGYWKFDEGYGDTANNSGNGGATINGDLGSSGSSCPGATACPTWTQNGKFGGALNFDGSNDYVDLGNSTSLQIKDFTFSAWVYFNSIGANEGVVTKVSSSNKAGWALVEQTNNKLYFYYGLPWSNVSSNSNYLVTGQWIHMVVAKTGLTVNFYRNGVPWGTSTLSQDISDASLYNLLLGRLYTDTDNYYLDGKLDEVKIYNYALTEDEIKLDYNQGSALVLGALSDTSGLTGGSVASSSASAAYCIPGDTTSCNPPVAEWKMDEKTGGYAYDTSGNGYLGTWYGTGSHWTIGKTGAAGSLNGTDDYVNAGAINNPGGDLFTINAWVKTTNSNSTILCKSSSTNCTGVADHYSLLISNGKAKLSFSSGDADVNPTSTTSINDNQWHFITGVRTGARTGQIYIDGKLEDTQTPAGSLSGIDTVNDFIIGQFNSSSYYSGAIDQIKYYNYARTPAQIAWDYNRGGPVGWWKMDECQGIVAYDASGNSNNGNITIGATGTNTSAGTCTGSAGEAWKDGVTGKYNSSLEFDGTDDWVNVGDPSNGSLDITGNATVSVWVKPIVFTGFQFYASKHYFGEYELGQSDNNLVWRHGNGSSYSALQVNNAFAEGTGVWYHITAVRDTSASTVTFYKNGRQFGSPQSYSIVPTASSYDLRIGRRGSGDYYFTGQIDDVKIFNYALTGNQIKTLFNENSAIRFGPSSGSP